MNAYSYYLPSSSDSEHNFASGGSFGVQAQTPNTSERLASSLALASERRGEEWADGMHSMRAAPRTAYSSSSDPNTAFARANLTCSLGTLSSSYPPRMISPSGYSPRPDIPVAYTMNTASVSPEAMFAQYPSAYGQTPPFANTFSAPQAVSENMVFKYANLAGADVSGGTHLGPMGNNHHSMHSNMDAPPAEFFTPGHGLVPSLMSCPPVLANTTSALGNQATMHDARGHAPIPEHAANTIHQHFSLSRVEPPIGVTPTFRCEIPNCGVDVAVDKRQILIHLLMAHDHPLPSRGQSVSCLWPGCVCRKQGTDGLQCKGRTLGHASHAEDIVDHIWEAHLGFQDVCPKCGDARWAYSFSMGRHENTCKGRQPVRCRRCLVVFPSRVAFTGHIELGQCSGLPPSAAE